MNLQQRRFLRVNEGNDDEISSSSILDDVSLHDGGVGSSSGIALGSIGQHQNKGGGSSSGLGIGVSNLILDDDDHRGTQPLVHPYATGNPYVERYRWFIAFWMAVAFFSVVIGFVLSLVAEKRIERTLCHEWGLTRRQKVLKEPAVILISAGGFRLGYDLKVPTPNLDRLRRYGTYAYDGLIPVFPTLSFPNHYSMSTGLYPTSHGIIANAFKNPKKTYEEFTMDTLDKKWWRGEPLWETAVRQGKRAATFFWPGTNVERDYWKCDPQFCMKYDASVDYDERVDKILSWLSLPEEERPHLLTLYFEEPDKAGHVGGPDTPMVAEAVKRIDEKVGRLMEGLQEMGILDDVHLLFVSDHGMLSVCQQRTLLLDFFAQFEPDLEFSWLDFDYPVVGINPPKGKDPRVVFDNLDTGLGPALKQYFSIYMKEEFPAKFNYSNNENLPPILGLAAEGYSIRYDSVLTNACSGSHGYDHELLSMRAVFMAQGPRFGKGRSVDAFRNIEIYNIVCKILGIEPAPNHGNASFAEDILLPKLYR